MYESPIERMFGEIQTKIIEQGEAQVMQAVLNCGISVDKEELVKALMYDRNQYEKGYVDAKAEQRWIPCSERLPEEGNTTYMTTVDYGELGRGVGQRFFYGKNIGWEDDAVVAWMPLPEPYRGEE